ncbi:putative PAP-specific phosphatase mitochondrial isoform X1 [Tripterygium wilfordii]|uniref:Putative PAP-specific phosphatase mitochondrial isoform X1 n=1 Tax=Tripterygium wilfordii TaxID=458696 RepID=A0A7J7C564_TRIWF|nr:putative PAP-specific phosphatase mitochondrial isoform X1 [Tripterygium wilfordii]
MFPPIPLVAEEDSAFLRSNNLVDSVVLDPTDGTKGFLKGDEALYLKERLYWELWVAQTGRRTRPVNQMLKTRDLKLLFPAQ